MASKVKGIERSRRHEAEVRLVLAQPMTYTVSLKKDGRVIIDANRFMAFDFFIDVRDEWTIDKLEEALKEARRLIKKRNKKS